ncbi:MAG: serine/threonine protein kinase, partial [Chlamydiia bacterium]|nr:serine/threonine protein kinase [Chlamydiia bacterium]
MNKEQILGDYKILKESGAGPLGKGFLAEHRFLKKRVLLKLLPRDLCQEPGFLTHFQEQVHRLATLNHPNI